MIRSLCDWKSCYCFKVLILLQADFYQIADSKHGADETEADNKREGGPAVLCQPESGQSSCAVLLEVLHNVQFPLYLLLILPSFRWDLK